MTTLHRNQTFYRGGSWMVMWMISHSNDKVEEHMKPQSARQRNSSSTNEPSEPAAGMLVDNKMKLYISLRFISVSFFSFYKTNKHNSVDLITYRRMSLMYVKNTAVGASLYGFLQTVRYQPHINKNISLRHKSSKTFMKAFTNFYASCKNR